MVAARQASSRILAIAALPDAADGTKPEASSVDDRAVNIVGLSYSFSK
jgi:hypothetical protein